MKKKARFVVTFLLMLSFGISALVYALFDLVQLNDKVNAQTNIEEGGHLQTIKLSVQEFGDNKKDELWHNGKLYDVSSYTVINDTVFVSVLEDDNEAQLIKNIADVFSANDVYISDGLFHIGRHHVPNLSGGKILVPPHSIQFNRFASSSFPIPYFLQDVTPITFGIIKPPPRIYS